MRARARTEPFFATLLFFASVKYKRAYTWNTHRTAQWCHFRLRDVITGDETSALFTLEMILTVERNIHQRVSGVDRRRANQPLHD